jgi:hypothetical protein
VSGPAQLAIAAAVAVAASARAQLPTTDSLAKLVPRASFVFVALVDSTPVPASPGNAFDHRLLARMQVIDTIQSPVTLKLHLGERVRLLLDTADVLPVGTRAVVFATGWLAGDQLSFLQVARFTVATRSEWKPFQAAYDSLRFVVERASFQLTVAASDVTAVAAVTRVVQIPDTRPPIARSEHDPVWARVSIVPITVFKGVVTTGRPVEVLAPTNRSHVWRRVPRLVVGDTALFVLAAIGSTSPLRSIDSTATFVLADSIAVRRSVDSVLVRP